MKKLFLYILLLFIANSIFAQVEVKSGGNVGSQGLYPVVNSGAVKGGLHLFQTKIQRDALPANFRDTGMLAYVVDSSKFFYLKNGILNTNWTVWEGGGTGGGSGIDSTSTSISGDTTFLNLYIGDSLVYSYYWQGGGGGGGGGGSNDSLQIYTSGATLTVSNGINVLVINPATEVSTLTITLPSSPSNRNDIEIYFGGTINAGDAVITSITILANTGQTLFQTLVPTEMDSGEYLSYKWIPYLNSWYAKR